jgi:hypothetical protein
VVLAVVLWLVASPLRRGVTARVVAETSSDRDELEARKEAKYREIRDTEQDHAQRKLSDEEFGRQDAELRAEAIEILKRIDEAESERRGGGDSPPASG